MAKYTITIKSLIDNNFDFQLTSYPIFDENYRSVLNNNILNHYYENEIGFETAPLFRFFLNQKLNEIMPYYNNLYKVQQNIINNEMLLNNVNLTEKFLRNNDTTTNTNANSTSNNSGTSKNRNVFQDTPQGKITQNEIENEKWATNVTQDKNETNNTITDSNTSNGTSNTNENYIKQIIGNNGNKYSVDVLNDIKNNLLNIDMMIINDLAELFMGIF